MADENDTANFPGESSSESEKRCDESKCLSTGLLTNPLLFNCYAHGPGTLYPYLCADDYVGIRVENDIGITESDPDLHYYTCCPPNETDSDDSSSSSNANDEAIPVQRDCEDPKVIDSDSDSSSEHCQNNSLYPYARYTHKLPPFPDAYMCCSVDNSSSLISGIGSVSKQPIVDRLPTVDIDDGLDPDEEFDELNGDDTPLPTSISTKECHPILFCDSCVVENSYLDLESMNCYNDVYQYPKVLEISGNSATYQCCSVPQESESSFLLTSKAYRATVWTQFSLALIACLITSMVIASILRSLCRAENPSSNTTRRSRNNGIDLSAYNFYVLMLALPDLLYNIFILGIISDQYQNGWIPGNDALIVFCATFSQCMNVVIAREVLLLLRRAKECKGYVSPSLKRIGIQFTIVVILSIALGYLWLYLLYYSTTSSFERAVRASVAIPMRELSIPIFYVVLVALPAVYVLWVCFEIWHKTLLPSVVSSRNGSHVTQTTAPNNSLHRNLIGFSSRFLKSTATSTTSAIENSRVSKPSSPSRNQVALEPEGNTTNLDRTAATALSSGTAQTSAATMGHLKTLAVFFWSIALVFFCLWVPGMIMYYSRYQPNRNVSGSLHNVGLIFFSLKAIVSNGIALSKPDVKKGFHNLCDDVFDRVCCCISSERKEDANEDGIEDGKDVHSYPTAKTAPASHGRLPPQKWPEEDIEVPIREESSDKRSDLSYTNPPSMSRIVTLHHEITNIGGIQVSQLTTHTISSFNSSSHVGGNDGGDSDDDDIPEFGFGTSPAPSPRLSRNILKIGDEDKDSKSDTKTRKSKKGENSSAEGWHSGSSEGSFKGRGSQRRNSQRRGSLRSNDSPASLRKKKKKHGSDHGQPKRRLSSSGRGSNHKRSSPVVNSRKTRRSSGSHIQKSGDPPLRNIQKRRNSQNGASDSDGPPSRDGISPLRNNSRHGTSKSPQAQRKNRRNCSSHRSGSNRGGSEKFNIKEIHVTNSPTVPPKRRVSKDPGALKKVFSISEIQVIHTPTGQPKQTIELGDNSGIQKAATTPGKSPVQTMVKKFNNANKAIPSGVDVSKQPFPLVPNIKNKLTGSTSTGTGSNKSESADGRETKNRPIDSNSLRSAQERRKSIGNPTKRLSDDSRSRRERRKSLSMRGEAKKRFGDGNGSRSPAPGERERRKSLSMRGNASKRSGDSNGSRSPGPGERERRKSLTLRGNTSKSPTPGEREPRKSLSLRRNTSKSPTPGEREPRKSLSLRGEASKRFSDGKGNISPSPGEQEPTKTLSLREAKNSLRSRGEPRKSISLRGESRQGVGDEKPMKNNSDTSNISLKRVSTGSTSNSSKGLKRPSYSKAIFNDGTVVENLSEDFSLEDSV